ncbi:MAG: hypothetical protein HOD63_14995 [Bacteroidetes bacterium]|jgi:DNA-binding transcriptional MerR regulator|nr:hypothetical protein [Bacteroidota bacterium]MBT6837244.1 hypothetical protein [Bacteroidota bacterium]MBT7994927.1 hypothetical protein [Bacteroidota bacterium]
MEESVSKRNLENLITAPDFYPAYYLRVLPLYLTGVSSRNFHHWKKSQILPFLYSSSQHIRLSVIEFFWVKFVSELRSFGVPIEGIKRIIDQLVVNNNSGKPVDYFSGITLGTSLVAYGKENHILGKNNEGLYIEKPLNIDAKNIVPKYNYIRTKFEVIFYNIIINKADPFIIIDSNFNVKIRYLNEKGINPSEMILIIPPIHYFSSLVDPRIIRKFNKNLYLLNDDEIEVIRHLDNRSLETLKVTLDNNEIIRIDSTENIPVKKIQSIQSIIASGRYLDLELTTQRGKLVKFKRTVKLMLPDKQE